jgi:hypothetical protein
MAKARVIGVAADAFGQAMVIDDLTNGWAATYNVLIIGTGAPNGFDRDVVQVHFGDQDSAATIKEKIANAIKQRFLDRGIPFTLPIVHVETGDRYLPTI